MKQALAERLPRARFTGLEVGRYLCDRYGGFWASVDSYAPARPFDLEICYDVLKLLE